MKYRLSYRPSSADDPSPYLLEGFWGSAGWDDEARFPSIKEAELWLENKRQQIKDRQALTKTWAIIKEYDI